ncbi:MAG: hypothetical protein ABH869_03770, partial [Candidatus Omnitrophota bacterium]
MKKPSMICLGMFVLLVTICSVWYLPRAYADITREVYRNEITGKVYRIDYFDDGLLSRSVNCWNNGKVSSRRYYKKETGKCYLMYRYDRKTGKLITAVHYWDNGKISSRRYYKKETGKCYLMYRYDRKTGKLITAVHYWDNGKISSRRYYNKKTGKCYLMCRYDRKTGKLVSKTRYEDNGNSTVTKFDSYGMIIEEYTKYVIPHHSWQKITYTYYENTKTIYLKTVETNTSPAQTFEYDENGNLLSTSVYGRKTIWRINAEGGSYKLFSDYYPGTNQARFVSKFSPEGELIAKYEYDEAGNLIPSREELIEYAKTYFAELIKKDLSAGEKPDLSEISVNVENEDKNYVFLNLKYGSRESYEREIYGGFGSVDGELVRKIMEDRVMRNVNGVINEKIIKTVEFDASGNPREQEVYTILSDGGKILFTSYQEIENREYDGEGNITNQRISTYVEKDGELLIVEEIRSRAFHSTGV